MWDDVEEHLAHWVGRVVRGVAASQGDAARPANESPIARASGTDPVKAVLADAVAATRAWR